MRVYRSWQPEEQAGATATVARETLDVRRRQATAEVVGVPRCPRCHAVLVAAVSRGRAGFLCRCIARLPLSA